MKFTFFVINYAYWPEYLAAPEFFKFATSMCNCCTAALSRSICVQCIWFVYKRVHVSTRGGGG